MKHPVIAILFVFGLLAVSGSAHAQTLTSNGHVQTMTFKADVPFPFVLGNQTLPAGTYQIQRLLGRPAEADEVGMIVVRGASPGLYKAVVTNLVRQSAGSPSSSHLLFATRAGQRYLSEVRIEGEKDHQIPKVSPGSDLVGFNASREEIMLAELR